MISAFKWIKGFFYNFICFIINHYFHAITFECITWSSSLSKEKIKLFAIVNWVFHASDSSRLFILSSNFIEIFFNWYSFIHITVTSIFNIIVTLNIIYSYWFIIIFFFFMLKKILIMFKYYIFNSFNFFF